MTVEQLFINGQEVDVTGNGVTFTMKSNLLGEFGKIVAGNSQTVKLPRTVRNMQVLGVPEVVSVDGGMIRRKLSAMLVRNGVPIIRDGVAVIVSSSAEGYEIGITYGVVSFLSLVKDGGTLNELPNEGEYVEWNGNSLGLYPLTEYSDYGFGSYDDGVNDTDKINVHPCVSLSWVLNKIQRRFNFEVEGLNELGGKYILLTSKRNSKEAIDETLGEYVANTVVITGSASNRYLSVNYDRTTVPNYKIEASGARLKILHRVKNVQIYVSMSGLPSGSILYMSVNQVYPENNGRVLSSATADEYGGWFISYDSGERVFGTGDYIGLAVLGNNFTNLGDVTGGVQVKATYVWDEEEEPEDVSYPGSYPIVSNLPSMKVADFIQICGVLTGTFPMVRQGESGVLRMVKVEDLVNNKAEAVDWSDKWGGEPDSVEYTYLDAQKNYIRWESDEAVEESGVPVDGAVVVDDETLEEWNDLIKMPLSGSNGGKMEQYSLVDGKVEDNGISERILVLNGETNEVAYTEELYPATLRDTVLAGYRDLVRKPIKVKGTFRLTELDVMGLDYMRPVYLRQLGKYYGVVQVQYKGDESVVELLQLP